MSQYKCKACSVPVTKSTAPGECSGDFPWWHCCKCATVQSGWAGWQRRACPQCRQRDAEEGGHAAAAASANEVALEKRKREEAALRAARAVTRGQARAGGEALEASTVITEAQEHAAAIIREAKAEAEQIKTQARQVSLRPGCERLSSFPRANAARGLRCRVTHPCVFLCVPAVCNGGPAGSSENPTGAGV